MKHTSQCSLESPVPTLTENELQDRLELQFPTRPEEALLNLLRTTHTLPQEQQWRWDYPNKLWSAPRNPATRKFGEAILAHFTVAQPGDSEQFPRSQWMEEVQQHLTRLPYEEWRNQKEELIGDEVAYAIEAEPVSPRELASQRRSNWAVHFLQRRSYIPRMRGPDGRHI